MLLHIINIDMDGSGLLIQTDQHNILVDLGYEDGTDMIVNYLKRLDVSTLDLLVITHPHRDHMAGQGQGGLSKFLSNFTVSKVWSNGVPLPTWYDGITVSPYGTDSVDDYDAYLTQIYPSGYTVGGEYDYPGIVGIGTPTVTYEEPRMGDTYTYGDLTLNILNPQNPHIQSNTNASSIVIQAVFDGKKIMLCADSNSTSEADILSEYSSAQLKSDILYLGHHGMDDSTTEDWYRAVDPDFVTVQRRDHLLSDRIKNLIASNGATLYDPYDGEDYSAPDRSKFRTIVFDVSSSGISVSSVSGSWKPLAVYVKHNNEWHPLSLVYNDSGDWVDCNRVILKETAIDNPPVDLTVQHNLLSYGYLFDELGVVSESWSANIHGTVFYLKPSTDYTLSSNCYSGTTGSLFLVLPESVPSSSTNGIISTATSRTVTTGVDGILYIGVRISGTGIIPDEPDFTGGTYWAQLEEGDTATPYVPY